MKKPLNLPKQGVVAIIGTQWGDEGKGKIVDLLAEWADIVARGTGGANAGHTIVVGGKSNVFHLVPSAILRDCDGLTNVIGRGVAFDPIVMLSELTELDKLGVSYGNLRISRDAHLVLPQHIALDRLREAIAGNGKIGTTGRGIGPVYTDHPNRCGLQVVDMLNPDSFRKKLVRNLGLKELEIKTNLEKIGEIMSKDVTLTAFFEKTAGFNVDKIVEEYAAFGKLLRPFITDTDLLLQEAVAMGKKVLLEGAQASLLSVDHGLRPNVTSSDSTINGLVAGVGLRGNYVDVVYAVVKAPYMTRVGSGVFPTEIGPAKDIDFLSADINSTNSDEQCVAIRRAGKEFGSTTGRARRPGWLDLPLLRYALRSGGDQLIITKADVMTGCREIKICTHYIYKNANYDLGDRFLKTGERVDTAFGDDALMQKTEPVYQIFNGWTEDISGVKTYDGLPQALKDIIMFISEQVNRPITIISVGPERDQTIFL